MSIGWIDNSILEGCIKNNRKAQETLYKQFYSPMMLVCMRYTRNEEDAIEVLHNAFLKVYKNLPSYDCAKASLYTWMKKVVVNSAIDFLRSKQKFKNNIELTDETEPDIENEAIHRIGASELLSLIRRLPNATQTVFNLYVVEGYNHREIGDLLGISEGTSKWHLSEGRKQLQQLLQSMQIVR